MKRLSGLTLHTLCLFALTLALMPACIAQNTQSLAFAGLRAIAGKGQFNSIQVNSAGDLYLLFNQGDGVRIFKTDAAATQIYAQTLLGTAGDIGIAMALDPAGDVYITGTTTSGAIAGTSGVPFPSRADSSTNSFVARFDSSLNPVFISYLGSGRMAATAIAATSDAVFVTGSIFAATLPVTRSAIMQQPATGSSGNGFVERFSSAGTELQYATYLTGFGGDTSPAAIAADESDNAYITGYTNASGYPTSSALVPVIIDNGSGFLTRLQPAGDGIGFSTFLPGDGITSLALDKTNQSLLLSGSISPGAFPIATVITPLVSVNYQSAIRLSLDGSRVLSSTLLAPGTQSTIAAASNGTAWVSLPLDTPLVPLAAISSTGNTAAFRINTQSSIDRSVRLGGGGIGFTQSAPAAISSIATDSSGQPLFAGAVTPITSASLLSTTSFDLPLLNAPTNVLPSVVHDTVLPVGANCGSLCTGSGAYLAKLSLSSAPALAFSSDAAPNITLRNLGTLAANNLALTASGYSLSHNCPTQLGPGAECNIVLNGSGLGTITASADNASQTIAIPSLTRTATPIVFSPSEIDFGVITGPGTTRTVTVTNLGATAQPVPIYPFATPPSAANPYTVTTDCANPTSPAAIQPGVSCHLIFSASLPSSLANAISTASTWTIGTSTLVVTAYLDPQPLNLSATTIDFGTQYSTSTSLRLPRYLYLSNNGTAAIQHTRVALLSSSPFTVTDGCPSSLEPHTVCQIRIDYLSSTVSNDAVTLTLDQGLSVLLTGSTTSEPGSGGTTVNPGLSVTPSSITFANSVTVTTTSSSSQSVTIANTGATPFPLSLSLSGDFVQSTNCSAVLSAASSCTAVISFAPSQPGTRQGLLAVSSGSGTVPSYVSLSGTGTGILSSSNNSLDLGNTVIGQPVILWTKISQPFSQLTASTSGDFSVTLVEDIGYGHGQPASSSFTPAATGSCANCWLGVQFLPAAAGLSTSTLSLTSSSSGNPYLLSLSGVGLPLSGLVLTPTQQDFGPIAVHSSSAPTIFTLTNLSSTSATISTPTLTGDFIVSSLPTGGILCTSGTVLSPGSSCLLQLVYTPQTTGATTGTLSISSATSTVSTTLSGYGLTDPGISFNPEALVFRNVPGNTATQQTITVSDTGIYNLQIGTPASDSSVFQAVSTCSTLTPGATCTITVNYAPASATSTGTLSIPVTTLSAGSPLNTYSIGLSGAYTNEDTGLQIIPGESIYGPQNTGSLGITRQFTINNLTAKQLNLSLSMPRQFVLSDPPCSTLNANSSCNFSVSFLPLANGDVTGTIAAQATSTDNTGSYSALGYVEGFGIGSGKLSITGDISPLGIVDFGQLASGQSSSRKLTLTNTGLNSVSIRRIVSEWPFLATTTCGSALSPTASCTISLTYTPHNQISATTPSSPFSTDTGSLVIESDADSSPNFVDLTGTVTPIIVSSPSNTAPLISYALSQGSLTFTATSGGNASAPQTVTLTNTGTSTIHFTGLTTTSDFNVATTCSTVVAGATCSITVTFTPQASSSQTLSSVISALEINSDAGTPLNFISLYGTAIPSTLVLSPVTLDFGSVLVGSSATLPIRITNGSSISAIFNGILTTGDYTITSNNCPATGSQLAPAASCALQITFTPTLAGTRSGTVSIATSLTTTPLGVTLTGIGAQSHLQTLPSSLSFPSTTVGSTAKLTLSLSNTGTAPVNGISFSISGDYSITTPCGTTVLASGTSCAIGIAFSPSASGSRTGSLIINSNDASSPLTIPLSGTGLAAGAFTLTVNGGSTASATVTSGHPASYNLAITPLNGYTSSIILNCTPINAGQYATCSLLPSSITLGTSAASSVATINTVTSVASSSAQKNSGSQAIAVCLLPLGLLFFRRTRSTLFVALLAVFVLSASGCGSGGTVNLADPNLRYTPPGTYQYQITATSTSGAPLSQTVTLNLTVTAR